MQSPDDQISSRQAAHILRVNESTLVRWRREGHGPGYWRIGGKYRYSRAEVLAYIDQARVDHEVK